MNRDNIKKAQLFLILVIIIILIALICILRSNAYSKRSSELIIEEALKSSSVWPIDEIPLIGKKGLTIVDFSETSSVASIPSGVTYEELREYLIKLFSLGFLPDKNTDSDNPKYLISSLKDTEIDSLTWFANKDKYSIFVNWAEDGKGYNYNFEISLNILDDTDTNDDISTNGDINKSGDVNISGDSNISGDVNISGDTNTSGDNNLSE